MTDPWFEERRSGPGVHALVLGVSSYPQRPFGLRSLHSAALSAARFAQWLAGPSFRHPEARIATIRLLLSPHSETERAQVADEIGDQGPDLQEATRLSTVNALAAWAEDLERDRRNVAVLYAAGHGIGEGGHGGLVLLADAGLNRGNPLDEALDAEQVRQAFAGPRAPQEQWYFVDACRAAVKIPAGLIRPLRGGVVLLPRAGEAPAHAVIYKSTRSGGRAFEVPHDKGGQYTTIFTHCLLESLATGVEYPLPASGQWVVNAGSLEWHLGVRVESLAAKYRQVQSIRRGGDGDGSRVLTMTNRPDALLDLLVTPPEAGNAATADVYERDDGARPVSRAPLPVLDARVPVGHWMLDVNQPPAAAYVSKREILVVWPPPRYCREIPFP